MKENISIEDIRKVKNPVVIKLRITNIDPRFDYATYLFRVTNES